MRERRVYALSSRLRARLANEETAAPIPPIVRMIPVHAQAAPPATDSEDRTPELAIFILPDDRDRELTLDFGVINPEDLEFRKISHVGAEPVPDLLRGQFLA